MLVNAFPVTLITTSRKGKRSLVTAWERSRMTSSWRWRGHPHSHRGSESLRRRHTMSWGRHLRMRGRSRHSGKAWWKSSRWRTRRTAHRRGAAHHGRATHWRRTAIGHSHPHWTWRLGKGAGLLMPILRLTAVAAAPVV